MNDIVLVSAYCDSEEKIKLLHDLLCFLKENNKKIFLASHLYCDSYIQSFCDYYFFDKENELIYDKKYYGSIFHNNKDFYISTRNAGSANTTFPVLKSLFNGVNFCYNNGFDVVHYLEYDSKIKNINEIEDNFNLIKKNNDISGVCYLENDTMLGNYFCLNVKKIGLEKFVFNKKIILENILKYGICEVIIKNEIFDKTVIEKKSILIRNDEFLTQIIQSGYLRFGVVYFFENKYHIFLFNYSSNKDMIFNIIEDGSSQNIILKSQEIYCRELKPNIRYIKIFGNNIVYQDYDLTNNKHIYEIKNYTFFKKK